MGSNFISAINIPAILVMVFCLLKVISLRKFIPGGAVGRQWRTLSILVLLCSIGYFVTPFFTRLPPEMIDLIVAATSFFGAIYVLTTIRLLYRITDDLAY